MYHRRGGLLNGRGRGNNGGGGRGGGSRGGGGGGGSVLGSVGPCDGPPMGRSFARGRIMRGGPGGPGGPPGRGGMPGMPFTRPPLIPPGGPPGRDAVSTNSCCGRLTFLKVYDRKFITFPYDKLKKHLFALSQSGTLFQRKEFANENTVERI